MWVGSPIIDMPNAHNTYFRNVKSASQLLSLKISHQGTLSSLLAARTCSTTKGFTKAAATWLGFKFKPAFRSERLGIQLLGEGGSAAASSEPQSWRHRYKEYIPSFINSTQGYITSLLHTHYSNALNGMLVIFYLSYVYFSLLNKTELLQSKDAYKIKLWNWKQKMLKLWKKYYSIYSIFHSVPHTRPRN